MTIGFDAKRAFLNSTGLGNYSRTVIDALCKQFPQHNYYAFTPKTSDNLYLDQMMAHSNLEIIAAPAFMPKSLWRSWGIVNTIQEKDLNVFHGLVNELPVNAKRMSCKKVVSIHDLIFESFPELYKPIDRKIYHYKFKTACENADTIIAISQFTKQEIINRYQIHPPKIQVVYQAVAKIFKQEYEQHQLQYIQDKYRLPSYFLLQVGTIEARKNAKVVLQALKEMKEDVHFVLVGKPSLYQKELELCISQYNLQKQVTILNNVSYYDLPLIYQLATAFVYPSRIEGFGIPVLEALYSKLPVIAATGSCLEEAGGIFSLYFQPDDATQLAQQITRIFSGNYHPDTEAIQTHLAKFDTGTLAQQLMSIYQST